MRYLMEETRMYWMPNQDNKQYYRHYDIILEILDIVLEIRKKIKSPCKSSGQGNPPRPSTERYADNWTISVEYAP